MNNGHTRTFLTILSSGSSDLTDSLRCHSRVLGFLNVNAFRTTIECLCLVNLTRLGLLISAVWCAIPCLASDYVLVVDTSGSMIGPISVRDSRVRINVVQTALKDFFSRLPPDNRVYLLSFNTGIASEQEAYIRSDGDRQMVYR